MLVLNFLRTSVQIALSPREMSLPRRGVSQIKNLFQEIQMIIFLSGHACISFSVREQTLLLPSLTTLNDPSTIVGLG